MITKFLRGDGVEFETIVGSEAFLQMVKDGSFKRVFTEEEAAEQATSEVAAGEKAAKPLAKMNRTELADQAMTRGLSVSGDMTKAQIVAAIEEHDAKK